MFICKRRFKFTHIKRIIFKDISHKTKGKLYAFRNYAPVTYIISIDVPS